MQIILLVFWIFFGIILYSYVGYAIILYLLVFFKRIFFKSNDFVNDFKPDVTLFVVAYNEKDFIENKVNNSFSLDYPKDKMHYLWVTDGSTDESQEILKKFPQIQVLFEAERKGKISAMNRGMKFVKTPIVIFSDANTILSAKSVSSIVDAFRDNKVGCVAGEKRIINKQIDSAAGAGEGIYWRYESLLKKWDSELYTSVGAAGELFAIRTDLFKDVEGDTILDDFMMSMRMAIDGYIIKYVPTAYAIENSSANVKEELKRKVRIAAGVIQSIFRLKQAFNPFHNFKLTFQFFSHKVLRWLFVPVALPVVYLLNLFLAESFGFFNNNLYSILFWAHTFLYLLVIIGWFLRSNNTRFKILFVPYYIFIMNYAMWLGFVRFLKGSQTVNWERAKRAT